MSLDQELLAQIDKYKDVMQKDPYSREFLTLAELYRKLGVAEEATNILREGLKRHPDYVDARLAIARIYLTQGQVEDATREFEEVIRQTPKNLWLTNCWVKSPCRNKIMKKPQNDLVQRTN